MPISSTIPVNMMWFLSLDELSCLAQDLYGAGHLYGGSRAFGAARDAFGSLMLVLSAHYAEDNGHAHIQRNTLNALGRGVADDYIVACLALHDTAEADECIVVASNEHTLRGYGQLV